MAAPTDTPTKGVPDSGAESPTTARPLEMDDDDVQETGVLGGEGTETPTKAPANTTMMASTAQVKPVTETESAETGSDEPPVPPAKPPRPLTEAQKNLMILKEAFPSVEDGVAKAVLSASGGNVERAFNALLEMTDPDATKNEPQEEQQAPPPQPPRPRGPQVQLTQMEADELYARQLAEHYDNVGAYEARTSNRHRGSGQPRQRSQMHGDDEDREYSFIDDELPVIRDNLRQGFLETQTKVNGWISTLRKRIEDTFDETDEGHGQGRRPGESSRRSGDYDADPQVLGDDFAGMRLSADGTPAQRSAPRTGVYRPPSTSSRPSDGRRVGFKDEPEEINMYETSPQVPPKDSPPIKASKWQPLSTVEPRPIGDNDPFSLGDSEDEKDHKDIKDKPKESTSEDSERLKKAAAEAMSDSLVDQDKGPGSKSHVG